MPRSPERTKPRGLVAAPADGTDGSIRSALAILAAPPDTGKLWEGPAEREKSPHERPDQRGVAPVAHRQGADPRPGARPPSPLTQAWLNLLEPYFVGPGNLFLTGTYSDDYGYSRGLMLVRNNHKDVQRFLDSLELHEHDWLNATEEHKSYRDILHNHLLLRGPFTPAQAQAIKTAWADTRGFAYLDTIHDSAGAVRYVTKYCLKSSAESIEWNLS